MRRRGRRGNGWAHDDVDTTTTIGPPAEGHWNGSYASGRKLMVAVEGATDLGWKDGQWSYHRLSTRWTVLGQLTMSGGVNGGWLKDDMYWQMEGVSPGEGSARRRRLAAVMVVLRRRLNWIHHVKWAKNARENGWFWEGWFSASCKCNTQTIIHCPNPYGSNCNTGEGESFLSSANGVMAIMAAAMVECHFC
jgi:hypothetical protein